MSKPFFPAPAKPASGLARYRLLSPTAGLHVSPIQLGAMNVGDRWHEYGVGAIDKDALFKLLDAYFDKGGNFIDTAAHYQDTRSEEFIGEWMEQRGIRDQIVVSTKYSINIHLHTDDLAHKITYGGNNKKSLHISLEQALDRLRTSYIDILYVHMWDWVTSVEEVMNSLHNVVASGKVLHLGISDTPAWVVAKMNQYARDHGKTPFVIYQGEWNLLERSFEREIIPMARSEGMALAPFNVLGGGKFRSDEEDERRRQTNEKGRTVFGDWERTEEEKKASRLLQEIGKEVGTEHVTSVAIAYVLHKAPFVFPIVGGRKVEHLEANLEALDISLTQEHIERLESVAPFSPGFPTKMIGDGSKPYSVFFKADQTVEDPPALRVITPSR